MKNVTYQWWALRKKFPRSELFSENAGKFGKMSSRITPNTDTFYAVEDSTDFSKEDIQNLDHQKKIQTATINKDEVILI